MSEIDELKDRLHEAQEQLNAIRSGEVDALVISGDSGEQVYTLKEADRPYRIIIEEMNEGTVTISEEGIILYSNKQFAKMLETTLSMLLGSSIYDFIDPSSLPEIKRLISGKKRSSMSARRAEITFHSAGNRQVHAYASFSPVSIDGMSVYCGVINDITYEKNARNDLQKSNELLKTIFNSTHILVAYLDKDLKFISVNHAFADTCGEPKEYFSGKSLYDFCTDKKDRSAFIRAVETGEPYSALEKPFKCHVRGPELLYSDWNLQPVKDPEGKTQGVILTLVDRTEHKKLEKERLMLEKAVEQAGDGIVITDPAGIIEYVNSASQEIRGFSRYELVGRPLDLLQGSNGAFLHVRNTLRTEGIWKGRISGTRKDGIRSDVEVTVSSVYNEDGDIQNYVVIEHDVTNEIKLEQQVRQMQKMEALGRLAGGIAHDLNNILYPIIINTEMLIDEEGPGTSMHQSLRQILTAAYRQRDLVRQILAFSRRSEQKLKPINVAPLIKESLKFLRASLPSTIEIRQNILTDFDMILGDPTQMHQIIMNLFSNAADALESQAGTIEVTLQETCLEQMPSRPDVKPGRYLQLTVSDTGRGMEHEVIDHIFEPFFTTKETSKSSGMGLAVVHGIVKNHKGFVSVESKPGKGSRFAVFLPLIDEVYRQQLETADKSLPAKEKKQVLLVDDEGIVLSSVQRALERLGYSVAAIKDAREALNLFKRTPGGYDLVITDQTMPHMTGAQLSEEVMHIRPDIPVILCTGFSEVITEQEAKDMGIKELLMKPATTKDLDEAINRALKG